MTLQTNRFIAIAIVTDELFCSGDEHFWRWTNTHFMLVKTNTSVLETNTLKTLVRISVTHKHTASYQRLPNRTYVELTSENVHFHAGKIRKLCRCTKASFKAKFIICIVTLRINSVIHDRALLTGCIKLIFFLQLKQRHLYQFNNYNEQ